MARLREALSVFGLELAILVGGGIILVTFFILLICALNTGNINKFRKAAKKSVKNPSAQNVEEQKIKMPPLVENGLKNIKNQKPPYSETIKYEHAVHLPYSVSVTAKAPIILIAISLFASLVAFGFGYFAGYQQGGTFDWTGSMVGGGFVAAASVLALGTITTILSFVVSRAVYKSSTKTYTQYISLLESFYKEEDFIKNTEIIQSTPKVQEFPPQEAAIKEKEYPSQTAAPLEEKSTQGPLQEENKEAAGVQFLPDTFFTSVEKDKFVSIERDKIDTEGTEPIPYHKEVQEVELPQSNYRDWVAKRQSEAKKQEEKEAGGIDEVQLAEFGRQFSSKPKMQIFTPAKNSQNERLDFPSDMHTLDNSSSYSSVPPLFTTVERQAEMQKRNSSDIRARLESSGVLQGEKNTRVVHIPLEELIVQMERAITDQAPLPILKELALKVQKARATSHESRNPAQQKKLTEIQVRLMRAMNLAILSKRQN